MLFFQQDSVNIKATDCSAAYYLIWYSNINLQEGILMLRIQRIARLLLSDEEILDYIYHYRFDSEQIARATHTDINLVALKVAHLIEKGYKLRALEHNSKFLKG